MDYVARERIFRKGDLALSGAKSSSSSGTSSVRATKEKKTTSINTNRDNKTAKRQEAEKKRVGDGTDWFTNGEEQREPAVRVTRESATCALVNL